MQKYLFRRILPSTGILFFVLFALALANAGAASATVSPASLLSSQAPATVNLGDTFQIKCAFSANIPCITAAHDGAYSTNCTFASYDGKTAVFNCTAKSAGLKSNYCNLFVYPQNSSCPALTPQINQIQSTNVINPTTNSANNPDVKVNTLLPTANKGGVIFTTVSNTVSSNGIDILTMSAQNTQPVTKVVNYDKYLCRCKESNGNPVGGCGAYWPDSPTVGQDRFAGCLRTSESLTLGPNETKTFQFSVTQYQNMVCGSFQTDIVATKINNDASCSGMIAGSVTYLSKDCSLCVSHASQKCAGNAVYWFDSCGNQQELSQQCKNNQTCSNGQCINIVCTCDSDCGTNAYTGSPFCQGNSVYQNYVTFKCNNPGTSSSYCSNSTSAQKKNDCTSNQACTDGSCNQKQCTPNWSCCSWSSCSNGHQTRTCTDTNHCGVNDGKPSETQSCNAPQPCNCVWQGHCQGDPCTTYDDCDGSLVCNNGKCGQAGQTTPPPTTCTPKWQTSAWGACTYGQQTRTCTDTNHCGVNDGKPSETQSCNAPQPSSCIWQGHCQGDSCTTYDDCDGSLICNNGKCGQAGQTTPPPITCTPKWNCTWNSCVNGQQTETCNDTNNCGVNDGKPSDSKSCSSGGTGFNQGMVSFTFDDGWLSSYQNGITLLDKYGIKSTEYIISGEVGDTANGYMTLSQILDLQSRGHEIEDHTKTHPDLTLLNQSQLTDEIAGSKSDLEAEGINQITSFDYPFGTYNSTVEQTVKNSGYLGARTADNGDNQKGADPYALKVMPIDSTTSVADIEQRISSAMANKTWLILLLHQVDNNGNQYDISPNNLSQVVDYIHQNNVKTVKVSEGISEMAN